MGNTATRSLITFAFVKDEFDRTGDLVAGLIPLFAPIFEKLSGQVFSPTAFCDEVQQFYGIRMHPWVAEDWAPRFANAGYLVENGDKHSRTYTCARLESAGGPDADELKDVLDDIIEHTSARLGEHGVSVIKEDVEAGVISRLKKPDFLHLLLKPQLKRQIGRTLSLPGTSSISTVDPEAMIDFVLAKRILDLHDNNKQHFDIVSRIASGALVSEIVLNLRNPPKVGQQISNGSVVYLDSPFLIDVLDLGDRERHRYATELIKDLKQAGAVLRTFDHNLEEIGSILGATLENHNDVNAAIGSVAYRLRTDGTARSRALSIKPNLRKRLSALGVTSVRMSDASRGKEKYFTDEQIIDLTSQIRPFGDIFSREVDAWSIGGVARHVLSVRPVANVLSLPAIFITKNGPLARDAGRFLVEQCNYSGDAATPFLTDRQAAGIMWLALGGSAGSLAERQLLANCASALTPRRDVLSAVYSLLEEADEKAAAEFEVLMTEDRCAHYVMEFALGDAALVTADNAVEILDQIKRIAIADVTEELESRREAEVTAERKRAEEMLSQIKAEHDTALARLASQTESQRETLSKEIAARDEVLSRTASELAQRKEEIEQQSEELSSTKQVVDELQRATIMRCVRRARAVGRNVKILIAFAVAFLIGVVGISTTILTNSLGDGLAIAMLIGGSLFVTAALTTLISWVAPDWAFAWLVQPIVQRSYDKAIQREGAESFADDWEVNLEAETVVRKASPHSR